MSFSKNLVRLRRAKGLSQENLADELDLSRQSISKWELEVSKPDTENLIKLSKLFGIRIDDLIGNEVIDIEALSINVKEDTKKIKMLKIWRGVVISGLILFIIIVIYKFVMLFRITKIGEHYKELNNYHYIIYTYSDSKLIEKEEYWFKDGISRMVQSTYKDDEKDKEMITCIDYKEKVGYELDSLKNIKENINVEEYLEFNNGMDRGGQLYSILPNSIKKENISRMIMNCMVNPDMFLRNNDTSIFFSIKDDYINLEKETLLPIINYYEDKNTKSFKIKEYDIELNIVDEVKI